MSEMMKRAHEHYADGVATEIAPVTHTIEQIFESAVNDFPNNIAIDFLGREFTYQELHFQIKQAATALTMCGVRRGDVVSLILPNCPQHYVAFYALHYLGAIVSEHNPLAPASQLHAQLESVGAKVVIAWEQTIETLTDDGNLRGYTFLAVNLVKALPKKSQWLLKLPLKAARSQREKLRGVVPPGVHSWDNQVSHAAPMNLNSIVNRPGLDDVAILIQTGGTTGIPKAVQLTHRNVVSNAAQVFEWLKDFKRGGETVGAVLPFFHAFGLQLSLSVCVGLAATQVMMPRFDVDMLLAGQKRHPITFFGGVPPMFQKILEAVKERKNVDLSTIRYSVSGAMPLAPELAAQWEAATGGYLIEGYGMSEASPVISGSPVNAARRPSTLGLPFPSTQVKIVNPEDPGKEVAPGEVGEILVNGPQVFQGYFNNEEETQLSFHDGWLRTGDLARWDDGFLVMADRRKELIINGGFNVYPSEVEAAVRGLTGVADVAVIGMPNASLGESVVAALVLEPGAKVDLEAVREWTKSRLSHYAMPKSIVVLEELPKSQLGKVLRKNVREQLANFELVSGEWKKKLEDASAIAASKLESGMESLKNFSKHEPEEIPEAMFETVVEEVEETEEKSELTSSETTEETSTKE
ncbi:MAG: AMP-binding protein [Arcanobacterium sp.]|nr:AMP-binding protein [Arcanobacterium sp.]